MTRLDTEALERWVALHLHYHGDRDRLLLQAIRPAVAAAWQDGKIDRFFFVRYELGGPHIRLRLRLVDGAMPEDALGPMRDLGSDFFHREPSPEPIPEDEIRRRSERLAAIDPHETMIEPVPDLTVLDADFVPETGRYGGPERLEASLTAFTVSSFLSLEHTKTTEGFPWSRRLPDAFRTLGSLAIGLSESPELWLDHLSYVKRWWRQSPLATVFDKADAVYERQAKVFAALWRSELERGGSAKQGPVGTTAGFVAGRQLAKRIGDASEYERRQIVEGQIHMTANRLGLTNVNEAYLVRLMFRSAQEIVETGLDEDWPDPALPASETWLRDAALQRLLDT